MNKVKVENHVIPAFSAHDIRPPEATACPELPKLLEKNKFPFLQTILFPVLSLAVYATLFLVILSGSFQMSYLLVFMGAGLIISLLCGLITFLVKRIRYDEHFRKQEQLFDPSLQQACALAQSRGEAYLKAMKRFAPPPDELAGIADSERVWERQAGIGGAYFVRIGVHTMDNPARLYGGEDKGHPFYSKVLMESKKCASLSGVPLLLPLSEQVVFGVVGEEPIAYITYLALQIAAFYSPNEVCIHCGEDSADDFSLLRKLPHFHIYLSSGEAGADRLSYAMDEERWNLFVFNSPVRAYSSGIYQDGISKSVRFTMLIPAKETHNLPFFCDSVLSLESHHAASLLARDGQKTNPIPDVLSASDMAAVARTLSKLKAVPFLRERQSMRIPTEVSFCDLYHVSTPQEIPLAHTCIYPEKGLEIPLGIDAFGREVLLNLAKDGPHGIMAGATGSGKSQALLSMLLSLAVRYHPDYVRFAFIDYKADSSAMHIKNLAHFAGSLSDLDDGQQIERALIILECEGLRRQDILNKAWENGDISFAEIEYYHRALREGNINLQPLPLLLIIIDEFVDLVQKNNAFLDKLSAIARQGRSRGMHILLAAQRPFSVAGSQIVSNSAYTICFQVLSETDSMEALGKSDAARISGKGRGFLKTVSGGLVEFQAAWTGKERIIDGKYISQMKETTDRLHALHGQPDSKHTLFFPPLAKLTSFPPPSNQERLHGKPSIPMGYSDNLYTQQQTVFSLGLEGGNVMLCGDPGSGKTAALLTMIAQGASLYKEGQLQFIVCGFGERAFSGCVGIPHVGSVIYLNDRESLDRLPKVIARECERRRSILADGHDSHTGSSAFPTIVVVLDHFDTLKDTYPQCAAQLEELSLEAFRYDIVFVYSCASYKNLRPEVRQTLQATLSFYMEDTSYSFFIPMSGVTALSRIPGRCLAYQRGERALETQIALPRGATGGELTGYFQEILASLQGERKTHVFHIPKLEQVITGDMLAKTTPEQIAVGISYETLKPALYIHKQNPALLISGTPQSGKSTLLRNIAAQLLAKGDEHYKLYVLDGSSGAMSEYQGEATYFAAHESYSFCEQMVQLFTQLDNDIQQGKSGSLCHVVIADDFSTAIERARQLSQSAADSFEKGMKRSIFTAPQSGLRMILSDSPYNIFTQRLLYGSIVSFNSGILLGGTLQQGRMGVELLPTSMIDRPIPKGYGYLVQSNTIELIKLQNDALTAK